ncbi:MAG: hypothetical protein ACJ8AO_01775 [Gemmatimonadaceae bacterium]
MTAATAPALPWIGLLLLGALHGINPGMGWLFAVALGLQEKSRRAVWGAIGPLALGHALALAAALVAAAALGAVLPARGIRWVVAGALMVVGMRALAGHRHGRWTGMRVGPRELVTWSFLMATAHGAGLMALPLVLRDAPDGPAGMHAHHAMAMGVAVGGAAIAPLAASLVHAAGYLIVTGTVAVIVYERLGLRMLRRAWVNLDLVWAAALVVTAVVTLVR